MWIRLKCRAGWLLRLKFSDNLLAEMFSLHQDGGGRSISSRRQHRERAYLRRDWEEQASLRREGGRKEGGREAVFATQHFFKSSCYKNHFFFFFQWRFFIRTTGTAESSTDWWPIPDVLLRATTALSVPSRLEVFLFSLWRPEGLSLSHSVAEQ